MIRSNRSVLAMLVALGLFGALASAAAAQIAYQEPPDLSPALAGPTPVGTVSSGLNTVGGTISTTWDAFGNESDDSADSFSFIVPPGLAVTGIELVISNYACANSCSGRARSFSPGIGIVNVVGNGTFTMPIPGVLVSGTYNAQVYMSQGSNNLAGGGSYTYQFRITAAPATNDLCPLAVSIGPGATAFNTTGATTDGPAHPTECNFFGDPQINSDLWYLHTPAQAGLLTVSTCGSSYDTELAVYSGSCAALATSLLACNDDNLDACGSSSPGSTNSQVTITVAPGQAYRIRVGGYQANVGAGALTLSTVTTGACCNRATGGCVVLEQADCLALGCTFVGFDAACSPAACTPCPADFNGLNGVTIDDLFLYINAYFVGC